MEGQGGFRGLQMGRSGVEVWRDGGDSAGLGGVRDQRDT